MRSIEFSCHKNHPDARAAVEWLAKQIGSAPVTAHLKNSVTAYRIDADLAGNSLAFITDDDIALQSLRRNQLKIEAVMKAGYREQVDMELETVRIELRK